jgi:3-oxoacyl-[acyl-carrier-protein] synthase II
MKRAAVLGLGQVSAVGTGVEALRQALQGRPPAPEWASGRGDDRPVAVLRARPVGLEQQVNPRLVRRLDAYSRATLLAGLTAWREAGTEGVAPERAGVILATGYGPLGTAFAFIDDLIDKGDSLGSPVLFAGSVATAPVSSLTTTLDLRGPSLTLTSYSLAWPRALALALGWLDRRTVDRVLLVSADELHEVAIYARGRKGESPRDGVIRPLDFDACTHVPGEAYSALVLARPGEGRARWGTIEEPRFDAEDPPVLAPETPVFLAAAGNQAEGATYRRLAGTTSRLAAYSGLWGASPTGDALCAVSAMVSLTDRRWYPLPSGSSDPRLHLLDAASPPADAIVCVTADSAGKTAYFRIARGE